MATGDRCDAIARLLCASCLSISILAACGGGGASGSGADEPGAASGADETSSELPAFTGSEGPLDTLQDAPDLLQELPQIIDTEVLADSGLQIAYTSTEQRAASDPEYIGAQWQHMQSCLGVNAPAPYIVLIDGPVLPFVATDDVIRDISGLGLATASVTAESTVVQITAADLDGSLAVMGGSLRSILGRTLWLGANLASRDYPFDCASTDPTAVIG